MVGSRKENQASESTTEFAQKKERKKKTPKGRQVPIFQGNLMTIKTNITLYQNTIGL